MNFYQLSEDFLQNLLIKIEQRDTRSNLDIEYIDGVLKIVINLNKKTFVINRNEGNKKIWYSSPFSGADYFALNDSSNKWINSQNIELSDKLFSEINNFLI